MSFSIKQAVGVVIVLIVAAIIIAFGIQNSRTTATRAKNGSGSLQSITERTQKSSLYEIKTGVGAYESGKYNVNKYTMENVSIGKYSVCNTAPFLCSGVSAANVKAERIKDSASPSGYALRIDALSGPDAEISQSRGGFIFIGDYKAESGTIMPTPGKKYCIMMKAKGKGAWLIHHEMGKDTKENFQTFTLSENKYSYIRFNIKSKDSDADTYHALTFYGIHPAGDWIQVQDVRLVPIDDCYVG